MNPDAPNVVRARNPRPDDAAVDAYADPDPEPAAPSGWRGHRAVLKPASGCFELRGAGVAVDGRALLYPLDLMLAPNRVVGLIGHNGSGKSTLLRLLSRQAVCSAGQVRLDGRPLDQWNSRAFARTVGYLPQTLPPAPGLLAKELVRLGRFPWHGALGRFGARDRERVQWAMALTRTEPFADRLVDSLSGGERQRVWLAMLVAQDARCLLLDEPISALDIAHQVEVLSLVQRLSAEHGIGVVVVLHDVNMAASFCDEIMALRAGRLIARGAPAELLHPEQLHAIYGIAMDTLPHPVSGLPISFVR